MIIKNKMHTLDMIFSDDQELSSHLLNDFLDLHVDENIENFKMFLHESEYFKDVFNSIFVRLYPFDDNSKYMLKKKCEFVDQFKHDSKKTDIITFLRNDEFFEQFYRKEIDNLVVDNAPEEFKNLLSTIVNTINIDDMQEKSIYEKVKCMIQQHDETENSNLEQITDKFVEKYKIKYNTYPNTLMKNKFVQYISNKNDFSELYTQEFLDNDSNYLFDQLLVFENVFQRELLIYEYFHFKEDIKDLTQKKNFNWIYSYHKKFSEKYEIAKKIYKQFLDRNLSHNMFCRHYLQYIDVNIVRFKNKTIDNLLTFDLYKTLMTKIITDTYEKNYVKTPSIFEVENIFEKFKVEKVHLFDNRIQTLINDFANELNDLKAIVVDIYSKFLRRSPFQYEINEAISIHLKHASKSTSRNSNFDHLRIKLFNSLEFDDVVKKIIIQNKLDTDNNCFILLEKFNSRKNDMKTIIWKEEDIISTILK
jgi:hypothetical protein